MVIKKLLFGRKCAYPLNKSILYTPHFMKIIKSGKPADRNNINTPITQTQIDELSKNARKNRKNSVYG